MVMASRSPAVQLTRTPSVRIEKTDRTEPKFRASSGGQASARNGTRRRARHARVDVGVVPHVERAGRAGTDGDGEQRNDAEHGMDGAGRRDHAGQRREHDQRHDARLQQLDEVADARPALRGRSGRCWYLRSSLASHSTLGLASASHIRRGGRTCSALPDARSADWSWRDRRSGISPLSVQRAEPSAPPVVVRAYALRLSGDEWLECAAASRRSGSSAATAASTRASWRRHPKDCRPPRGGS